MGIVLNAGLQKVLEAIVSSLTDPENNEKAIDQFVKTCLEQRVSVGKAREMIRAYPQTVPSEVERKIVGAVLRGNLYRSFSHSNAKAYEPVSGLSLLHEKKEVSRLYFNKSVDPSRMFDLGNQGEMGVLKNYALRVLRSSWCPELFKDLLELKVFEIEEVLLSDISGDAAIGMMRQLPQLCPDKESRQRLIQAFLERRYPEQNGGIFELRWDLKKNEDRGILREIAQLLIQKNRWEIVASNCSRLDLSFAQEEDRAILLGCVRQGGIQALEEILACVRWDFERDPDRALWMEFLCGLKPVEEKDKEGLLKIAKWFIQNHELPAVFKILELGFHRERDLAALEALAIRSIECGLSREAVPGFSRFGFDFVQDKEIFEKIIRKCIQDGCLDAVLDALDFISLDPQERRVVVNHIIEYCLQYKQVFDLLRCLDRLFRDPFQEIEKESLIALAKTCLRNGDARLIAHYLHKFKFNPSRQEEKAVLCVLARSLAQNFEIAPLEAFYRTCQSFQERVEIFCSALEFWPKFIEESFGLYGAHLEVQSLEANLRKGIKIQQGLPQHPDIIDMIQKIGDVIQEIPDQHAKERVIKDVALFLWMCRAVCPDKDRWMWVLEQAKEFIPLKAPHLRWSLLAKLSTYPKTTDAGLFMPLGVNNPAACCAIPFLASQIASRMTEQGRKDVNAVLKYKSRLFRDDQAFKKLIRFLLCVENSFCMLEEKELIFRLLAASNSGETLMQNFSMMTMILELKEVRELSEGCLIQEVGDRVLKKTFGLEGIENFDEKWEKSFGASRNPGAIKTYGGKVKEMGEKEKACFCRYMRSVLEGEFPGMRYSSPENPHLKSIQEHLSCWRVPLSKSFPKQSSWTVQDTDDPYDLLLCGTEVPGSCQDVGGDPILNQGLLGYLMNGQTRLLVVKDSNGCIVARRIFRLLCDREGRAVLFLEKAYGDSCHDQALRELAVEKAKFMGLVLTCAEGASLPTYASSLHSHGGLAPCEYSDAGRGVLEGAYEISQAQVLWKP